MTFAADPGNRPVIQSGQWKWALVVAGKTA